MPYALSWERIRHGLWVSTNGIYEIREHKSKTGVNYWGIRENYKTNPFENEKMDSFAQAQEKAEELFAKRK